MILLPGFLRFTQKFERLYPIEGERVEKIDDFTTKSPNLIDGAR